MNKEKNLTTDDLPPMHDDTYFFGYGIDIKKPYDMANQIIKLKQENQELKKSINKAIEIIKNDRNYDDNDFEGGIFQKDILNALEGQLW